MALLLIAGAGIGAYALDRATPGVDGAGAGPAVVVDSVQSIDLALEEFRADIPRRPVALEGGFDSPEALVVRLRRVLAQRDSLAIERMALDRGEFAYLYYPSSPLARPPYELPPALAWFRMQQENRTGALRLLRELGGADPGELQLNCSRPAVEQGDNRILAGCQIRSASGAERRLFGALLEHGGHWKVLSFAGDY